MKIRKNGFTLVELIIVVGIISILVVLAISYFRGQIFKGNDARRKADLNRIKIAIEEYEKDHNCYPPPEILECKPGTGLRPYLEQIPCDPNTGGSYPYENDGSDVCPLWYRVYADLQNLHDLSLTSGIGPDSAYNYYISSENAPKFTPAPTAGLELMDNYWGCKSGICVPVSWDPARPPGGGPECDSGYDNSNCSGQCGSPGSPTHECVSWH